MCKLITPATRACSGQPLALGGDASAFILLSGCLLCQMLSKDLWLCTHSGCEGSRPIPCPGTAVGGLEG